MYSSYCNPVQRENTCASTCLYIDTTETKNQEIWEKKKKKIGKSYYFKIEKIEKRRSWLFIVSTSAEALRL